MPGDGAILTLKDVVDGALTVAISQIGVKEAPNTPNSGPEVDKYLASVRLPPGNAWCMAFEFWCYMRAIEILSSAYGHIIDNPCPRTGSVLTAWDRIDDKYKSMVPRRGSLYFADHGKRKGHTGFIIDPSTKIDEVSGNTNQEGSRDGNSVWRHSFRLTDAKVHGGKLLGFAYFG